jgi:ubiquinone biosynthesis protein
VTAAMDLYLAATQSPFPSGSGITFFVVLFLLALISGRLLGGRISWPTQILAAFLGLVVGVIFAFLTSSSPQQVTSYPQVALPALLATMAITTLFELMATPRGPGAPVRGWARIPRPLRALRRWLGRTARYIQIVWIAARNGLNPYLGEAADVDAPARRGFPVRLRRTLEQSKGVFVKLGQLLSTRPDVVPPAVIAQLASLQDAAPPEDSAAIATLLVEELGAEPSTVFAEFDERPMAAASIAQVHRARLKSGEPVVVKVQRPAIRPVVERDLDIMRRLARSLDRRAAWARRIGAVDLADGFAQAITEELDFRIEAGNIEAVRAAAGVVAVQVPRVFRELSSRRVLVIEWLDGVSIRDAGERLHELGLDRRELARQLLLFMLRQIMLDGVFHADPHPGNVMVLRDGRPALIDFGSVGRLDAAQQSALRRLLVSVDRRNAAQMRDALLELADGGDARTGDVLERALSQFMARRLGPGMAVGADLFADLLQMLVGFQLRFPPHVTAVFRALVTLEDTLAQLAPGFQILDESRLVAAELLHEAMTASSIQQAVRDEVLDQLPVLKRLPRRVDQLLTTTERGQLAVQVSLFAGEADRALIATMVGRALLAFLGATIGVISVMLLGVSGGPRFYFGGETVLHGLGYAGLVVSLILMLRVILAVARDRVV